MDRPHVLTLDRAGLDARLLAVGLTPRHAQAVRSWVFRRHRIDPEGFVDLDLKARATLAAALDLSLPEPRECFPDPTGASERHVLGLGPDRVRVEAVLMLHPHRVPTLCVSTQAGCPMGCTFCATGRAGLTRNLTAAEILAQVFALRLRLRARGLPPDSHSVVYMGMGEPFANTEAVLASLEGLVDRPRFAINPKRITVSTLGLPEGIRRLTATGLAVNLALSLHAIDPALRARLMPATGRIPLREVLAAAAAHQAATGRRLVLEYALLAGVNDSQVQLAELGARARELDALVNLIPWNPVPGLAFARPEPEAIEYARALLDAAGTRVTVRSSAGTEVAAGCGQLAGAVA